MKHLKLFFALFAMLALGVGNAWGADSGITASDGVFVIDFYNSDKLTSTSGTDLSTTNYSNFVKVASGLTKSNVVTSIAKDGTVQYNKNGGLTIGSSKVNAHYVTFNIGSDYAVNKITVYATQYESGRLLLNGKASDSGKLGTKGSEFSKVTQPLVWDNLNGATTLKFTKDNGSGSTQKRITIYTIVCEYTTSGGDESGSEETVVSLPTFTPESGTTFTESLEVTLSAESGCDIYYTTDDTEPTTSSTKYTSSIKLTESKTIKAIANNGTKSSAVATATYTKVDPTGTFTLHTGDLVEGDYVIYYSGKAMKALLDTKNRLQYEEVTPTNNKIVDPLVATIWHIAPSGTNWTVYNENVSKYAAGTGTKSEADLVADLTGDNANKAAWTVTASDNAYEFVNVWNTSKAVNATLRNNTTYGFACYATSTGGALSLYRKAGAKYDVTVNSTTNGTVTADPTSAEVGTTITLTVTPETGYVLDALTVTDANSNSVTVIDNKFTMPASDVTVSATFKENEKPAATLTLSKNGVTEDITGNKQDDVVTLPTTVDTDCVKEFVGWSADANCATEPEYAPGASYTLASTSQTLYAVYATVEGGGETTSEDIFENNGTYNDTDPATIDWTLQDVVSIVQEQASSTSPVSNSYIQDPRWYKSHVITITPSVNITKIVTKAQSAAYATALATSTFTNATATAEDDVVTITPTNGSEVITVTMGAQARLYTLTVTYGTNATYSNYSTTCSAALANPTFSLEEGKYTETKSVEITATEGTVYYTLDGTEPTASSTEYTGAIALNDCGEYTIKAIAISADSQSDVVSATYTIKLPLTNSQAAPYTEAEAIAAYDGGCYDNQDVYVKGTVKSAAYNSTYGNYTITLTNGFQFFRLQETATEKFTEDKIGTGDVIVACGKFGEYEGKCQLAAGCYLVEHEPYTEPKTDISNTEATAYTVDKAFELIADVKSDLSKEVYVKGLVAVASTQLYEEKYLTYSISDNGQNSGNVLKVYDGLDINGVAFTSKDDVKVGDYVVVKGKLYNYGGTYEINKDNQLVQHIKAATITIADITMEVGETKTIAATVVPAEAEITYTIKENAANAISLSGNVITANAVGTATITATIETAADYMGKTVDFTVTVTPESTSDEVVILAELDGKWYAMKGAVPSGKSNQLDALEVTYLNGTLYNVAESDKASITWTRSVVDGKATFVNNGKYLKGGTSTDLNLVGTVDNNCKWMWNDENGYYTTNTSGTIRTFLYRENYNFKNYGVSQAGEDNKDGNYGNLPVVTAPVYKTGTLYTIKATADNGNVIGAGIYEAGAKVTLMADPAMDYTFVSWTTKDGEVVSTANPFVFEATENLDLVANFAEISKTSKTLSGTFSVGPYEVAQFATGNLQYKKEGENETWRFAKQQYQYVGEANINVGDDNFEGWIDMFGWSNGDANNFGVNPSNKNEDYTGEFQDWGTKMGEGWSTLSADQWKYLLNTRPKAKDLKQIARVGSVVGIMLFPDNWNETPVVDAEYDSYYELYMYNYSITQWTTLEAKGALFLPAAGRRTGGYGNMINYDQEEETNSENLNGGHYKHQDNTNIYCYYWTSTINETTKNVSYLHNIQALGGDKYTIGTGAIWGEKGRYGQSVRLAKVTNTLVPITEGDNTEVLNNNDGKNVDVKVTREFTTGNLYTIALPFTLENVSSVFGNQAYEYTSLGENGVDVVLYFSKTNTMESGKPYLIEPTQDVLGFIVEDVTLSNTANNIAFTVDKTTVTMIPVLSVTEGADNNGRYWLAADRYLYNNTNTLMSLRALFNISTVNGIAPRARVAFSENSTTGLDNITNGENTTIKVIENGQLIIIRNGEKFNAQGVKF